MKKLILIVLIKTFTIHTSFVFSQDIENMPFKPLKSNEILNSIKKLKNTGLMLYVAAHPDDENQRVISYFTKYLNWEGAYFSFTRGEGGQNLIGAEKGDDLSIIRTAELIEARKIDGGKQFFSSAKDFGFSKTVSETFKFWNKEKVTEELTWVIRYLQPNIIITRFSPDTIVKTHGHHTASAILALETYKNSNDNKYFKDQIKYDPFISEWKCENIFWNTSSFFYQEQKKNFDNDTTIISLNINEYLKKEGKSIGEIATESRSKHSSQAFGGEPKFDTLKEYFVNLDSTTYTKLLIKNANQTWFGRFKKGLEIDSLIDFISNNFNENNPENSLNDLIDLHKLMKKSDKNYRVESKINDLEKIILSCIGLYASSYINVEKIVPGDVLNVNISLIKRVDFPVKINSIYYFDDINQLQFTENIKNLENLKNKDNSTNYTQNQNRNSQNINQFQTEIKKDLDIELNLFQQKKYTHNINLPYGLYSSQPSWINENNINEDSTLATIINLNKSNKKEKIDHNKLKTKEFSSKIKFKIGDKKNNTEIILNLPILNREVNEKNGELFSQVFIMEPLSVTTNKSIIFFNDKDENNLKVTLEGHTDNIKGSLILEVPEGWNVSPLFIPFTNLNKNEKQHFEFKLKNISSKLELSKVRPVANVLFHRCFSEYKEINYPHIGKKQYFKDASIILSKIDFKINSQKIGYIMGAGDETPEILNKLGYELKIIEEKNISLDTLNNYKTVIIGIRAYNILTLLKENNKNLLKYVENGGKLIVQYNNNRNLIEEKFAPYDLKINRDRVTEEDAKITFIKPEHTLLNKPNIITKKDFDNWVQERGLYYPSEWASNYETIISMNDENEKPLESAILYAKYGKGVYIYTSLSFFRQLPAGVPGAIKLFVNLIEN